MAEGLAERLAEEMAEGLRASSVVGGWAERHVEESGFVGAAARGDDA